MKLKHITRNLFIVGTAITFTSFFVGCKSETKPAVKTVNNETLLKAQDGFSVEEIAKDLGAVRHLTISKNGDIYANRSVLKDGKAIVLLKDTDKDGTIDEQHYFADVPGTGILAKDNYLYASSNSGVFRYKMNANHEVIDTNTPEKIVDGLIDMGADNAKPFAIDNNDNLYVTIGSWNDACRDNDAGAGMMPCAILDSAGGIWKFKADELNQSFADGSRYVTGIKKFGWHYLEF